MKNFYNTKTYRTWKLKNAPVVKEAKTVAVEVVKPVMLKGPNGRFLPGQTWKGRQKGTPNRRTADQLDRAERLLQFIENNFLESDVKNLTPAQRCTLWKDVLVYRQPALSKSLVLNQTDNSTTEVKQVFIIAGAEFTFSQKQ